MKASRFNNILFAHVSILLLFSACTSAIQRNQATNSNNNTEEDADWLIPSDQVYVGTGRDGIPSIDDPSFVKTSEVNFLRADDLVLGIKIGDQVKAYPHRILDYHEIVNDRIGDIPIAISYCPLTGSGIAWNRKMGGETTTFGVSGLIHKNNLIAYDRTTNSYWSQMMLQSIYGEFKGTYVRSYQLIEMKWSSWQAAFPNSKVLSGMAGFESTYEVPAYGNYANNNENILFPIEDEDDRMERKDYGHGVSYNSSLHVIPMEGFSQQIDLLTMYINGKEIIVAGSLKHKLAVSYSPILEDGTRLNLQAVHNEFPVILQDEEGTKWNVFGEAVSGSREGQKLPRVSSYNAYWFAWADFFGRGPKVPKIIYP
ncbi:DUF3179 domain-containing protein [Fodinibius salsisoli]|uniref:DUF3179 domain-containing protein n=1 Tax=Fodinibius salsisoli TaxID=2820877 RepID=A0ABT3PSE0_9BACT|nr:DUF3179 domain-containing protein [Fodinibius salsisoli]MCW9708784.1 DUF3179 domain-containing protein [Fodinibius salsisoli]